MTFSTHEEDMSTTILPLLPLRDVVVFPHMVIPLFVGRPKSIKALEAAMEEGKNVVLIAQKSAANDDPTPEDLYDVGSIASILQMLKLPDGTVKVLVEGIHRARINHVLNVKENYEAEVTPIPQTESDNNEVEAMRRSLFGQFDQYVKLNKKIPPEVLTSLSGIDNASRLSDTIAAHLPLKLEQKQQILENFDVPSRLEQLLGLLETEIDILQVEKRIRGRVKRQMEKSQREYYLNEQVKAIQKELGDSEEGADLDELEKKIKAAHMPKEAKVKAEAELKKLKLMSPMSAEATVVRNYIDTLVALPWKKKTKVSTDLKNSEQILDADHYGLTDVMFVATANTLNIPAPLLDRMETIRLSGYTEEEKVHIAKMYLLPKQFKSNGIKEGELTVTDSALRDITRFYTREAGVRGFDLELAKISPKVIKP